ncbi:hypothetical protein BT63DRAFT_27517 [Microthyrium microscopicum]|uniref:Flap structure-specific endonuclease n=1 Tax=Microthyrium microscopicum TaxID=703497 RepID=A0A6A6URV0_9PEZI|nr:hypothetical protein BT63DRAFT_27517 [Microthyrium microscopicum]
MGIHGIYKEIGPGERIALSKFALQKFKETGRPLRLAVDISIWLFQIKASKGGEQPALRTFYYRILRLTSLAIQPLFVFDGPNKPQFKRNKWSGPNVATVPEFLAKQLLKEFGLPYHTAPGEAEAECALLQRERIVDAVLSEDVDTIMFGSGITLRSWSPEGKGKTPTHVNVYDSVKIKAGVSGLDREGMILVAMMSGGDYIPEGIPGCGPKLACEAARAGFGLDLCKIKRNDKKGYEEWKERLSNELKTNENKLFKRKHGALQIPESFPNRDILKYYTHPAISSAQALDEIREKLVWEKPMDLPALRKFTEEAFKWENLTGAKKFIRTLAPALLVRKLRSSSENQPSNILKKIHQARTHSSTDNIPELRVSFIPLDVVDIDLSTERPDDQVMAADPDDEEADLEDNEPAETIGSTQERRPYLFEPSDIAKEWISEHYVQLGEKRIFREWTDSQLQKASKATTKAARAPAKKEGIDKAMPAGALHKFTRVTKGISSTQSPAGSNPSKQASTPTFREIPMRSQVPSFRTLSPVPLEEEPVQSISLLSSSPPRPQDSRSVNTSVAVKHFGTDLPPMKPSRGRRTAFRRVQTEGDNRYDEPELGISITATKRKANVQSPAATPKANKRSARPVSVDSPSGRGIITHYFSPSKTRQIDCMDLTMSSPAKPSGIHQPQFQSSAQKINALVANTVVDKPSSSSSIRAAATLAIDLTASSPPNSPSKTPQSRHMFSRSQSSSRRLGNDESAPVSRLELSKDVPPHHTNMQSSISSSFKSSKSQLVGASDVPPGKPLGVANLNKQRIRVRESLPGAFTFDNSPQNSKRPRGGSRWQEFDQLDLTNI